MMYPSTSIVWHDHNSSGTPRAVLIAAMSLLSTDATFVFIPSSTWPAQLRQHPHPGSLNIVRSEEHTSELQSLMRISYAVFCLKKKTKINNIALITVTHYKS